MKEQGTQSLSEIFTTQSQNERESYIERERERESTRVESAKITTVSEL